MSRKTFAPNESVLDTNGKLVWTQIIQNSVKCQSVTVNDSATLLPTTALSRRKQMVLFNNGSQAVYIGGSDVTTANGFVLLPRASFPLSIEEEVNVYGIVSSGTADVRVWEAA